MDELKKYSEWCTIFQKESDTIIIDDDGGRQLQKEGRLGELLTRQEAFSYFVHCTAMFNIKKVLEGKECGL
jgi:hypothetical protein